MTEPVQAVKKKLEKVSLAEAVTRFLAGKNTTNDVARAFLYDDRVKSLISTSANSKRVMSLLNDIVQDSMVLFHEKYICVPDSLKLPSPDSVYSLVFAIGEGISLTKRREQEQNKFGFVSLDNSPHDSSETYGNSLIIDDDFEEKNLKVFDVERGGNEWNSIIESGHDSPLNRHIKDIISKAEDALEKKQPIRSAGERVGINSTEGRLTPEQKRLKDIRNEIGLKLEDYANYLSITQASLSAYIYGRTDAVPPDVIRTADRLHKEHCERFEQQRLVYEGKSMDEVIDYWCGLLGIERAVDEKWVGVIAGLVNVKPITVRRWIQEKYRPPIRKLIGYGLAVEESTKNTRDYSMSA